jgi:hypothetical protein
MTPAGQAEDQVVSVEPGAGCRRWPPGSLPGAADRVVTPARVPLTRWPRAGQSGAGKTAWRNFGSVPRSAVDLRQLFGLGSRSCSPGDLTARVGRWPLRPPPAGPLPRPYLGHKGVRKSRHQDKDDRGHVEESVGIGRDSSHDPQRGQHNARTCAPRGHPYLVNRFPGLCPGRGALRLDRDRSGRDVGGGRGQIRVGLRCQHLAHPQVKLVFGQPSLNERGLKHLDRLLAVSMRRPQAAPAARAWCHLVFRPCRHWHLPTSAVQRSVTRLPLSRPSSDLQIRSSISGHPDPFGSVRDLGRVIAYCSFLSRIPKRRSPRWPQKADDPAVRFARRGPPAFQGGHIQSWHASRGSYPLSLVVDRWSLLSLSPLLSAR